MTRFIRKLSVLAFVVTLVGCGGGGGSGDRNSDPAGEDPVVSSLECGSTTTTLSSAPPLTRVSLSQLSGADPETDWVWAEADNVSAFPTALYGSEQEGYEVLVPLHPNGPEGGLLTLRVADGTADCSGIRFEIEPLPAYTGDPAKELVESMEMAAVALADRLGVTPAELDNASLDQLDPELVVLAVLLESLNAVDLDAALGSLTVQEHENLQALLARLDLAPMLNALAEQILALPDSTAVLSDPDITAPGGEKRAAFSRIALPQIVAPVDTARNTVTSFSSPSECINLGAVDRDRFGIDTPEELADYIKAARGAADLVGPLQDGINDLNAAFMVLGLIPGGGWTTAGIGVVWSWLSFTVDLANQMRANLYPSTIDRIDFDVSETLIPEDWDVTRDGAIEWSSVLLFFSNKGMNMTRAITDGTLNTVSSAFAAAGAPRGALNTAEGLGLGAADMVGREAIDKRLDELEADDTRVVECWNIQPTEWFPVPVPDDSGNQWVSGRVQSGEAITLNDREITPVRIGSANLRVETNTDNLPGPRGFLDRSIEVARKVPVWSPKTLFIEEGNTNQTVRVRLDNTRHADPQDVEFVPDGALLAPVEIPIGNNVYEVTFLAPEDRTKYPLEYTVRSTSRELPPSEPAREATLTIFARETIAISPRNACVGNSQPRDLVADVSSLNESPQVNWNIVAGQGRLIVGGNGQAASYIAPETGSGAVTIRAELEQSGNSGSEPVEDEVTFTFGDCAPVAVFYEIDGDYRLPGFDPGCASPGNFSEEFSVRNDNETNDGGNIEIPLGPSDFWGPGQTISVDESRGSPGSRGTGGTDNCSSGFFPVDFRNQSDIGLTSAGDTVDFDIDLIANGTCGTFGNGFEACSTANTFSAVWVRYQLDVERAKTFQVELDLECTDDADEVAASTITLIFLRTDANGNPVPNHSDPDKFLFPTRDVTCTSAQPALEDIRFEVDAPAAGSTDTMTVMIVTSTGASTTREAGLGPESMMATLMGTVRVGEVER